MRLRSAGMAVNTTATDQSLVLYLLEANNKRSESRDYSIILAYAYSHLSVKERLFGTTTETFDTDPRAYVCCPSYRS